MYAAARASAGSHEDLQRHITDAMGAKAEWESKVQVLQQELQSLANATPELLEQLEYEVEEIKGVVADLESEKQGFLDQSAGLREAKAQLKGRSLEVQSVLRDAKVRSRLYSQRCSRTAPAGTVLLQANGLSHSNGSVLDRARRHTCIRLAAAVRLRSRPREDPR